MNEYMKPILLPITDCVILDSQCPIGAVKLSRLPQKQLGFSEVGDCNEHESIIDDPWKGPHIQRYETPKSLQPLQQLFAQGLDTEPDDG